MRLALIALLLMPLAHARRPVQTYSAGEPWSPQKATGAPDVPRAGDDMNAWASLDPNGGMEWLEVGFESAVTIAQVRVHQNLAPGAIVKVTASAGGESIVLWEGEDPNRKAPAVFSVKPTQVVKAKQIRVHIDARKVNGWNEIDAVQLLGTDGSKQWASTASASTSYAWRGTGDTLGRLMGKPVTLHLLGDVLVKGTVQAVTYDSIRLDAGGKTLLVMRDKLLYVER